MRKALIVGISDYNSRYGSLPGCLNDMQEWRDLLVSTFKFQPDDIRLLANDRATKAEILIRLEWLFSSTDVDSLVFCFAGHGASIRRREYDTGDLLDHMDEALVSYPTSAAEDIQDHLIFDDDLAEIISRQNIELTNKLTLVFDACHAGGMLRDILINVDDAYLPRSIVMPPDVASRELSATALKTRRIGALQGLEPRHVICAAAKDIESAWDARMEDGLRHGAFSYSATRSLMQNPTMTLKELTDITGQKLALKFPQHPQLLGNEERYNLPFTV
ncbi:hypothetical protein SRABI130_02875 [Pseudomonas sp. Bi130]|uniref:caspase family protein n=1 Tax=Pseudomonas sp. Bi130 TaxID=2821122 RepID=UPI001DF23B7B|nr:caspase family protein [Pseudomonas sp. Bi130]CAH0236333.1 hypothetical protein SRABI130_02875 [Pseudomonas sp. Bi130]